MLKLNPVVLYVPLHVLEADPAFTKQLCKRVNVAAVLPRIVHDGEMLAIRSRNNLIFDRNGNYDGTFVQIADKQFSQETAAMDSGSRFADPLFRNLEKFDFTLAETYVC